MFKLKGLEKTWTGIDRSSNHGGIPRERWGATMNAFDGKLYVIGGFSRNSRATDTLEGGFLADFHEFDLGRRLWRQIYPKGTTMQARSNHCAIKIKEKYSFHEQNIHSWRRRKTQKIQ
jgi:N-acetylneuraminic acid mutarotase